MGMLLPSFPTPSQLKKENEKMCALKVMIRLKGTPARSSAYFRCLLKVSLLFDLQLLDFLN